MNDEGYDFLLPELIVYNPKANQSCDNIICWAYLTGEIWVVIVNIRLRRNKNGT